MPKSRSMLLPTGLVLASVLVLSGCSVLENLGIGGVDEPVIDEITETIDEGDLTEEESPEEAPAASAGFVLPTCDTLYSDAQKAAFLDQVRVSVGDTSDGDFGYGTTNRALVAVLKNVRSDLRLSCTWYLPASESVSVTSLAILDSAQETSVSGLLTEAGAIEQSAGGGTLWTIDKTTSDESPDYIATEAHFLAPVACPSSLAETNCVAWFTTNYAFGQAQTLTVDAARNLGVYSN
jgi:hypothetical protein